jgi:hypothetical protein
MNIKMLDPKAYNYIRTDYDSRSNGTLLTASSLITLAS